MSRHTPGPWKSFQNSCAIGVGSKRSDVAWVRFADRGLVDTSRSLETDKANAKLIAAAPELLGLVMTAKTLIEQALNAEGDVFGVQHNEAVDTISAIALIVSEIEEN